MLSHQILLLNYYIFLELKGYAWAKSKENTEDF